MQRYRIGTVILAVISLSAIAFGQTAKPQRVQHEQGTVARHPLGEEAQTPAAETGNSAEVLLNDIVARLAASRPAQAARQRYAVWPPTLSMYDTRSDRQALEEVGQYNAFAYLDKDCMPRIGFTVPMFEALDGDQDALAFILGHELGHLLLGHTACPKPNPQGTDAQGQAPKQTPALIKVLSAAYTREQEYAADLKGLEIALAAGYSRRGVDAYRRLESINAYTSFESLSVDHPAPKDRLAKLDAQQATLWRSMSAFDNGVYFLLSEHYPMAAEAFSSVTEEFPDSYEAWSNLGYARLMQYADALRPDDVARLGFNQVVAGGFFARSASLESKVRGVQRDLWESAMQALVNADRLKPDSTLIKANLGLAHLLNPDGPNAGQAVAFLEKALALVEGDQSIHRMAAISLLVNLGVAYQSAGRAEDYGRTVEAARQQIEKMPEDQPYRVIAQSALMYNLASYAERSANPENQRAAYKLYERYLTITSPNSAWWPLALKQYNALAATNGWVPRDQQQLSSSYQALVREVYSVEVPSRGLLKLGMSRDDLAKMLGPTTAVPIVEGTRLASIHYEKYGLELVTDDRLLAIILDSPQAPAVKVRPAGVGAKDFTVRVGMKADEFENVMGQYKYTLVSLIDPKIQHRFYPALGLAALVGDDQTVQELVVTQLPR